MHPKVPSLFDFNADAPVEENTPLVCRYISVVFTYYRIFIWMAFVGILCRLDGRYKRCRFYIHSFIKRP